MVPGSVRKMGNVVLTSYLSHGAPTSLIERTKIHDVYTKFGHALVEKGVDTIVISSPHYLSKSEFQIESREDIPCIQDYYGFPDELYKYSYNAKNNLTLVALIESEAASKGIAVSGSDSWGLDHGAWLPLYFMFPESNVKVVPVSITGRSPEEHFLFGDAIKSAVEKSDCTAAVIGTGSPLHRLDLIRFGYYGPDRFEPGEKLDNQLIETVAAGDFEKILRIRDDNPSLFRAAAPEGNLNPLYISLGASDRKHFVGRTLVHEFMYYGVSLVAILLSADDDLTEKILSSDHESARNG